MEKKSIKVTHTLPSDLVELLHIKSDETGLKMSSIVKKALEDWFKKHEFSTQD